MSRRRQMVKRGALWALRSLSLSRFCLSSIVSICFSTFPGKDLFQYQSATSIWEFRTRVRGQGNRSIRHHCELPDHHPNLWWKFENRWRRGIDSCERGIWHLEESSTSGLWLAGRCCLIRGYSGEPGDVCSGSAVVILSERRKNRIWKGLRV